MSVHLQRALFLKARGRPREAISEIRAAIREEPENALLWSTMAAFLNEREHRHEALGAAREAVRLDPEDEYGHYVLSAVHADRGEMEEAMSSAREAIRLAPEDAENRALLARIHIGAARWEEALEAAGEGLALDAENAACWYARSTVLAKLGRHEEAQEALATLSRLRPDESVSHHARGCVLIEQGEFTRAKAHFLEALRVDPNDDEARQGLALCLRARHSIYGWIVRLVLWLGRFRSRARWGLWLAMVAVFVGTQRLERAYPEWAPYLVGINAVWWLIAVGAVLAGPLFTLALRLDREGRQVLSRGETRASNCQIPCILLAGVFGILAARSGFGLFTWSLAMLGLTVLFGELFETKSPWVRRRLAWLAASIVGAMPAGFAVVLFGVALRPSGYGRGLVLAGLLLPVLASVGGFFADDIRGWLERRGPDDAEGS